MLAAAREQLAVELQGAQQAWPKVRTAWHQLHSASPKPTAFLSTAWVDCWLGAFADEMDTLLWTARAGERIVGAALLVQRTLYRRGVPIRTVFLNTAGEGQDSVTLEHNSLLCLPDYSEDVWMALAATMAQLTWDEWVLPGISPETMRFLARWLPAYKIRAEIRVAPFVDIAAVRQNMGILLQMLSANARRQLRQAERSAAAIGAVTVEEACTQEEQRTFWEELAVLHTARWNARGHSGAFVHLRWRTFHDLLRASGEVSTRLFRLRAGGTTLGVIYLLQYAGHVCFYQSGIREMSGNAHRPGLLLHRTVIEKLAGEAVAEYDFLASPEAEVRYKRTLATSQREMVWATVQRSTWRVQFIELLRAVRIQVRTVVHVTLRSPRR